MLLPDGLFGKRDGPSPRVYRVGIRVPDWTEPSIVTFENCATGTLSGWSWNERREADNTATANFG
jgi:hypothetical protein